MRPVLFVLLSVGSWTCSRVFSPLIHVRLLLRKSGSILNVLECFIVGENMIRRPQNIIWCNYFKAWDGCCLCPSSHIYLLHAFLLLPIEPAPSEAIQSSLGTVYGSWDVFKARRVVLHALQMAANLLQK